MPAKDKTITYQGQTILLDISFYDHAGGSPVDHDDFAVGVYPSGYIYNPSSICLSSGAGLRISQGKYYYSYAVAADAPTSNTWNIFWKITINGIANTFSEFFTVLASGADNYNEIVEEVRFYINDDAVPYTYTAEKIGKSVQKALPIINNRAGWACVYTSGSISPTPDSFQREIYSMQAACFIIDGTYWKSANKGIRVTDGDQTVDLAAGANSTRDAVRAFKDELEQKIKNYLMNNDGYMIY